MLAWTVIASILAPHRLRWLALVHSGRTAVAATTLLIRVVSTVVAHAPPPIR